MEDFQAALVLTDDPGEQGERSAILHQMAGVLVTRGDLDGAMQLYQQSLQILEALGDVRGKSATLHSMANVLVTRGDLDGAMQLYQQSLQIKEALGDVRGKSATLNQMANVLVTRDDLDGAMRLYEQSLQIKEALGDVRGKSVTLHQMAIILGRRDDLDGAMRLYEQSLQLREALGDVQGKGVTLANMAEILAGQGDLDVAQEYYEQSLAISESLGDLWGQAHVLRMLAPVLTQKGEREQAIAGLRRSLALFERLGAIPEIAPVQQLLEQIMTMSEEESPLTPMRLAGALAAMATAALRGEPSEQTRAALSQAAQDAQLGAYAAALAAALDREPGAAGDLLAAAETLLAEASPTERAAALSGVANIADLLGDTGTELAARQQAIEAKRHSGDDRETLVQLSVMLYNLAIFHQKQGDFGAAVPLLEEVVALDLRTEHPDLESDRAALEAARRRASGQPEPTLRDEIDAWRDGDRDEQSLASLLNLICNLVVAPMQAGDRASCEALAQDLAQLRAVRPLPIAGANEFLHVLQLWLRGEEAMREQAARIAAGLPGMFQDILGEIERMIAGEGASDVDDDRR